MKVGPLPFSIIFGPAATSLLVSTVTLALGSFIALAPRRAAMIWGSHRLTNLAPERRASFLWWYRAFGFLLCLAGVLIAVDSIVFPNYR